MRLLFFGTYDARRHPRVAVLRDGCRAHGDTVDECNVPIGFDTDARVRLLKQPWLLPTFAVRLLVAWARLWWRAKRLDNYDAIVVGYLGHLDVRLARGLWPRRTIALDYLVSLSDTAADRDAGGGIVLRALARLDRRATRTASIVVVDTEEQRATVLAPPRRETIVVPVGAPDHWFTAPRDLPATPLRVVFFGLYTPLQGAPVIGRAIAALAGEDVTFTMAGSGQDLDATRHAANDDPRVDWRDWVDPEELPALVSGHHVCLGIFGTGAKALRVVPNKVYQGAAAGCALVTSDTAPQRRILGDAACYVPPGDAGALAHGLRDLARDPQRVAALRRNAYDLAEACFRPENVVAPLREALR